MPNPRDKHHGYVYFARAADTPFVKIGWAGHLVGRLANIQSSIPHELIPLGCVPGRRPFEAAVMLAFAECRVRGEWFESRDNLAAFLDRLPTLPLLPGHFDFRGAKFHATDPAHVYPAFGVASPKIFRQPNRTPGRRDMQAEAIRARFLQYHKED